MQQAFWHMEVGATDIIVELCKMLCLAPSHPCAPRAGLLFAAGAAAWSLPLLFLVFTAVCMPWRAVSFYRNKWVSITQRVEDYVWQPELMHCICRAWRGSYAAGATLPPAHLRQQSGCL